MWYTSFTKELKKLAALPGLQETPATTTKPIKANTTKPLAVSTAKLQTKAITDPQYTPKLAAFLFSTTTSPAKKLMSPKQIAAKAYQHSKISLYADAAKLTLKGLKKSKKR